MPSSQGRPEKPQSCSDVTLRIDPTLFTFSSPKKGPIKGWPFRIAAHTDTFFEWSGLHITLSDLWWPQCTALWLPIVGQVGRTIQHLKEVRLSHILQRQGAHLEHLLWS